MSKIEVRVGGRKFGIDQTFLDRAINYVHPVAGQRRFQSRVAMAIAGSYHGGATQRSATKNWNPLGGDADTDLLYDLDKLRDRSRDLLRNDPLAIGAVNTVCTNVVGSGLRLKSQIDRTALGLGSIEADALERQIENEFALWSRHCDIGRTSNFVELQELLLRSVLENGDAFTLLTIGENAMSPYSLRLQLVEADRVSNPSFGFDTETQVSGIEKDTFGAPVAYHVSRHHPGAIRTHSAGQKWDRVPAFTLSGRRGMLHHFRLLRIGQTRGIPYLAPVIETLKQVSRYTESELMAAVVASLFTVFVKSDSEETPFGVGDLALDSDGKQQPERSLGSGAVIGLAPGEDVSIANPSRPNALFDTFILALCRQIGVALELPLEVFTKHFESSYSAARAALLEAWKFFLSRRQWFVKSFCEPVFEAFMDEAVASGRISAPGYFADPMIRMAYLGSMWIGPAKGMLDETKEIAAAEARVKLGVSTLTEETSQMTGGDYESKNPRTEAEVQLRRDAGLFHPAVNFQYSNLPPDPPAIDTPATPVKGNIK